MPNRQVKLGAKTGRASEAVGEQAHQSLRRGEGDVSQWDGELAGPAVTAPAKVIEESEGVCLAVGAASSTEVDRVEVGAQEPRRSW